MTEILSSQNGDYDRIGWGGLNKDFVPPSYALYSQAVHEMFSPPIPEELRLAWETKEVEYKPTREIVHTTVQGTEISFDRQLRPAYAKDAKGNYVFDLHARPVRPDEGSAPEDLPTTYKYAELFKPFSYASEDGKNWNFALPDKPTILKHINGYVPVELEDAEDGSITLTSLVFFKNHDRITNGSYGVEFDGWDAHKDEGGNVQKRTETKSVVRTHWIPNIGVVTDVFHGSQAEIRAEIDRVEQILSEGQSSEHLVSALTELKKLSEPPVDIASRREQTIYEHKEETRREAA